MRIIVVSDTHGRIDSFVKSIKSIERPKFIIHLGDYVEDGEKIQSITNIETVIVKGNGDYFNQKYEEDKLLEIEGKRFFITHGHKYSVRNRLDTIMYRGEELKADVILFGHTHIPIILEEANMMIMNPGSPSYPRGVEREKTFGIIDISKEINMSIERVKDI